jgi:BirA family biotin operon repressor/biotin-[acetyl-CoA-carboxylase] ligase
MRERALSSDRGHFISFFYQPLICRISQTMNFERLTPIRFNQIDSTNAEAMRMLKQGKPAEGTCIVASFQEEGRGQRSNVWTSRAGENLLVSFILYPRSAMAQSPFLLSKTIALAVQKTIANFTTGNVQIKWPNDVLIDGKKAAGILLENQWAGSNWQAAIAGIGINVNQTAFALETATSLASQNGQSSNVALVLAELQKQLSHEYERLCNDEATSINADYHRNLFGKENYNLYQTPEGRITAKVVQVNDNGRIELITANEISNTFDLSEARLIY